MHDDEGPDIPPSVMLASRWAPRPSRRWPMDRQRKAEFLESLARDLDTLGDRLAVAGWGMAEVFSLHARGIGSGRWRKPRIERLPDLVAKELVDNAEGTRQIKLGLLATRGILHRLTHRNPAGGDFLVTC